MQANFIVLRSMKYFLLFVSFLFLLFPRDYVSAATGGESDFLSTDYTVDVSLLDPIPGDHGDTQTGDALTSLLATISNLLLFVIVILAGIAGIVAGYFYIMSGADEKRASTAKNIIKYNIIALFVAFFSYSIILLVAWLISV